MSEIDRYNPEQEVSKDRKVSKSPYKVLDAPNLSEDFYLNLLDWSSTNLLAVGLERAVYIWSAEKGSVTKLVEVAGDDMITSVNWHGRGSHIAVGTHRGITQVWDVNHEHLVQEYDGHHGRVSAIAWCDEVMSTGSRDHSILHRDIRSR